MIPALANARFDELNQMITDAYKKRDIQSALTFTDELLEVSKQVNNSDYIVKSYLIKGFLHSENEDFGKAVLSYLEGARYAETTNDIDTSKKLISIYKNLAIILGAYKHYDLAHRFNQKGLNVARKISEHDQVINLLHNDGYKYLEEEKYDSAISIFKRILIAQNPSFRKRLGLTNDLGLAYWNQGKLSKASLEYGKILKYRDSVEDKEFIAKAIHNLALVMIDEQKYEKAVSLLEETSVINSKHNYTSALFLNYKNLGKSWFYLNNRDKAIEYYLKAAKLFDEAYVDPEDYDIFGIIADFYETNNQPDLALQYEKQYNEHLASFIAKQKEIENLDKKYNMELLTQRYFDLLEVQEVHQQTMRDTKIGLGAGILIMLFIMSYLLYREHVRKIAITRELRIIEESSEV